MPPMNPRLLRPLARSGDSDVRAYIAAVEAADQQSLEQAVKDAYRDFIVGCKADGIWDAIKTAGILLGARTLSGALVPLKGSALTNNNFVSGDYSRATGLVGNASNKSITLPFNGNDVPQNDIHGATHVHTAATSISSNFPTYIGAGSSNTGSTVIGRLNNSGQLYIQIRQSAATFVNSATGFLGVSRDNSANFVHRVSGTSTTVTLASQSPYTAQNFSVFRDLASGVAFSNGRQSFFSAGSSLDLSLLDTRVSALVTAIGAAIP